MTDDSDPLDANGYPTEAALEALRTYPESFDDQDLPTILRAWFAMARRCWHWPERWRVGECPRIGAAHARCGYLGDLLQGRPVGEVHSISTGGWSGNEAVIGAMKQNAVLWAAAFRVHYAGGHYELEIDPC